jgi:hypothetical protein
VSSAYGRLVAACDVEDAALAQLQAWLPDYLCEVERTHGLTPGDLPRPRSWIVSSAVEKMPEDQLPAVILASPGLVDGPQADGRGIYTARWRLVVGIMAAARGNRYALRLVRLYALGARASLLQQQALPGLSMRRIDWLDERYRLLDSIDDRSVCVAEVELSAEVADVTTRHAGPLAPLMGPGDLCGPDSPQWPQAQSAEVEVLNVTGEEP